ncbi:hypothetical protein Tco_0088353 [Tanacetum coccineum]
MIRSSSPPPISDETSECLYPSQVLAPTILVSRGMLNSACCICDKHRSNVLTHALDGLDPDESLAHPIDTQRQALAEALGPPPNPPSINVYWMSPLYPISKSITAADVHIDSL